LPPLTCTCVAEVKAMPYCGLYGATEPSPSLTVDTHPVMTTVGVAPLM
jgi:hypothetical protein